MPPWLDWLDWLKWDCIGAGVIGKILGLWFRGCAAVAKKFFGLFLARRPGPKRYPSICTSFEVSSSSLLWKSTKILASTLLALLIWAIITWKPIWNSAGASGDRILAGVLLLVSALWVISVIWISFSTSMRKRAVGTARNGYVRSNSAKAS